MAAGNSFGRRSEDSARAELGATLRRLRRERGLSQRDLLKPLCIASHSAIVDWEAGRRLPTADTLSAFARYVGADPGALLALRERVLAERAAGTSSQADEHSGQSLLIVPRQLPADVAHFVGRASAIATLDQLVSGEPDHAAAIAVIGGMAGIGKTALAIRFACRVASRFPDGQLYINLRGFDPSSRPVAPEMAMRGFLDALGVPSSRIPADLEAQGALFRSLLAERRLLVVLDNARGAHQIRPLLPGAPGCLVLVTSRNQLTSLAATSGAHLLDLDVLPRSECRQMLAARVGRARIAAEPRAADDIITRCARLPLALAVVAARMAARPGFPLSALTTELDDDPLDALSTADDPVCDVRTVFSWSYRALSPAAARVFRQLGLHWGPDISAAAAASLAGVTPPALRALLAELARASLITEAVPGRYVLHDLIRAYARQLAESQDDADQRAAALSRAMNHYLHSVHAAASLLDPSRDRHSLDPPRTGVVPERPGSQHEALVWFTAEHAVLVAAVTGAVSQEPDACVGLASRLWTFFDWRGHWHDQITVQLAALSAARHLADVALEAQSRRLLAGAYERLDRLADAEAQMRHALKLHRSQNDQAGTGHALLGLAIIYDRCGRHAEALSHSEQALQVYAAAGHLRGQFRALNAVGWSSAMLGDYQRALSYCQRAIELTDEHADWHGLSSTWDTIGYARYRLGQYDEAITSYRQALALFTELGDRAYQASVLRGLGECYLLLRDAHAARDAWIQAAAIFDDLGRPDGEALRAKLDNLSQAVSPA